MEVPAAAIDASSIGAIVMIAMAETEVSSQKSRFLLCSVLIGILVPKDYRQSSSSSSSSRRDYYDGHPPPRPDRNDRERQGRHDNAYGDRYKREDEVSRYPRDEADGYRRGKRDRSQSPPRRAQNGSRASRPTEAEQASRGRSTQRKNDETGQLGEEEGEVVGAGEEGGDAEEDMMAAMGFGGFGTTKVRLFVLFTEKKTWIKY